MCDCVVLCMHGCMYPVSAVHKTFCFQKVDGLKAKRDRLVNDLREVVEVRRKEPELQNLLSQITGLEMRLKHSRRDKDITVRDIVHVQPTHVISQYA